MLVRACVAILPLWLLAACATPLNPAEITRFHLPERASELGQGSIAIVPFNEKQEPSSGYQAFEQRLTRTLIGQGYDVVIDSNTSDQIAYLDYRILDSRDVNDRAIIEGGGPGAIGTGGSVGGTLTIPFGGPGDRVHCRLRLFIADRAEDVTLWEARGKSEAKPDSPDARPIACADKMISAMFSGFPGRSGETITVP